MTIQQINTERKALAYLSGVLHGDGWCSKHTIGMRVKDQDFSQAFAHALSKIAGQEYRPKLDERGYWLVTTGNRTGRFNHLKPFKPEDDTERSLWLRGLFDSEGNAQLCRLKRGEHSYSRRVAIYSTDQSTLIAAAGMLGELHVPTKIRATKNSVSHKGTKIVYELAVKEGRDNFDCFYQAVGSSIGRKHVALGLIVGSYIADLSGARRQAQRKGAVARRRKTMEFTLPSVIDGVRRLIRAGIKPTQRACRVIPGYNTIQRIVPQAELVAMAQKALR